MPDLLILGSATQAILQRLQEAFTIHTLADLEADWLDQNGHRVTHVLTNAHDGMPPKVMDALPRLQMISCFGVGYDSIDVQVARSRGVMVTHTPDVLNAEVATTAVLLLLSCYREVLRDDAFVRSGQWETGARAPFSRSVDNQVIGLLGFGRIGQAIARKLEPWSPRIVYHSRTPKDVPYQYFDDLTAMAAEVDALICITPGGEETRHLVNAEVLRALGPKGTLINVARGSVVDEPALIDALSGGELGWAGLDVFQNEPFVPEALRQMSNVVLLPHVGSATHETRHAMAMLTVDNLLQHATDGTVKTPVPELRDRAENAQTMRDT